MYPICEHIKDNGERCGSPALQGHKLCFFHNRAHNPIKLPGQFSYKIPVFESAHSIQIALTHITQALLDGTIDRKTADVLLRAVRLGTHALRFMRDERLEATTAVSGGRVEKGLTLEPNHLNSAGTTNTVSATSTTRPKGASASEADETLLPSHKHLSTKDLALLRRIVRKGPKAAGFGAAARLIDLHSSGRTVA